MAMGVGLEKKCLPIPKTFDSGNEFFFQCDTNLLLER
jgi:hypothetical protein